MKVRRLLIALWVFMCAAAADARADKWETDFAEASALAKASNRYMLLDFSGSDWCGWCMKLDGEVFSKRDFRKYAEDNLVCVLLDFPHKKPLKKSLKDQNGALATQYGVKGYPTVIILSPVGDIVGRSGYKEGGAEAYVAHLKGMIDPHREAHGIPAPTAERAASARMPVKAVAVIGRDENREMRTWQSRSGATLTASLLEEQGGLAILRKQDGSQVKIAGDHLSAEDQSYIERQRKTD